MDHGRRRSRKRRCGRILVGGGSAVDIDATAVLTYLGKKETSCHLKGQYITTCPHTWSCLISQGKNKRDFGSVCPYYLLTVSRYICVLFGKNERDFGSVCPYLLTVSRYICIQGWLRTVLGITDTPGMYLARVLYVAVTVGENTALYLNCNCNADIICVPCVISASEGHDQPAQRGNHEPEQTSGEGRRPERWPGKHGEGADQGQRRADEKNRRAGPNYRGELLLQY